MPSVPPFQGESQKNSGLVARTARQKGGIESWVKRPAFHGAIILFNFWWGCTKVTSACKNCYAEELAVRSGRIPQGYKAGSPRLLSKTHNAAMLRKWDRLAEGRMDKVFCHSMSDVFDEEVSDNWRVAEFLDMSKTENLWYLFLTKRPHYPAQFLDKYPDFVDFFNSRVWLGTSLGGDSDIAMAEALKDCPARLHWISYEPAIEPLDVSALPADFSWIVVGGESGKNARPFEIPWAIDCLNAARARSDCAVFVKQLGRRAYWNGDPYPTPRDPGHGADPADWPAELRVREFPI